MRFIFVLILTQSCSLIPKHNLTEKRISCINDFLDRSVGAEKAHSICKDLYKEL